jgi:hypothetical protein
MLIIAFGLIVYASKGISINVVYNIPKADPPVYQTPVSPGSDSQYDEKGDLRDKDLEKTFTSMTQAMQDIMLDREDTNNGK